MYDQKRDFDKDYKIVSKDVIRSLSDKAKVDGRLYDVVSKSLSAIEKLNIKRPTISQAIYEIERINLIDILGLNITEYEQFDCLFFSGNKANISCSIRNNKWRYRSEGASGYKYINLVGIVQIAYNVSTYKAVRILTDILGIEILEDKWLAEQKMKYVENIVDIENANEEMAVRYPILHKYIKKHLYLLEKLNTIGLANVYNIRDDEYVLKTQIDDSIFFASASYISKLLASQGISVYKSTVARVINMYATLGMVVKVKSCDVPKSMYDKAMEIAKTKDHEYLINFLTVPEMTVQVLAEAEKRAKMLIAAGVAPTHITEGALKWVFSDDLPNSVFLATKRVKYRRIPCDDEEAEQLKKERAEIRALRKKLREAPDVPEDDDYMPF